jgi:hypothetical protein
VRKSDLGLTLSHITFKTTYAKIQIHMSGASQHISHQNQTQASSLSIPHVSTNINRSVGVYKGCNHLNPDACGIFLYQ